MKARILGSGTSSGVPRIGNDWGRCDPSEARNRRTRSALLVEGGGERVLIDCGPDLREQLLAAQVGTVDRVILTHDHADHCHGIDDLRQIAHNRGCPVPFYCRPEPLARLLRRFAYAFEGTPFYPPVLESFTIDADIVAGTMTLRFVDQPHGNITSLGIRVEERGRSLAYSADFHAMTEEMAALYRGVEVWVCDCLRRHPHPTHAHLGAVLGWARELGVGQLLLTHLDNSMDYATLRAELPDWAMPAHDGLEISL